VVLAVEWLRLWSQTRVIVLAPIAFCAAGCSADPDRFNDASLRGQSEATGTIAPRSTRATGGTWSWDGGTAITVARGDTVDSIAHRHHVPASVIIQANNLGSPNALQPGRHLVIPRYSPALTAAAPEAPLAGTARLVPPSPIPASGSEGIATGAAAPVGAPETTAARTSRPTAKSPVAVAKTNGIKTNGIKASDIRTQAGLSGGRNIVQPLKSAIAQPARPAPEQHQGTPAARKLAAPAEKLASVESVKGTDAPPSFHWPVRGQVVDRFGPKTDGQRNNGIDIAVPENTPIKAADDGVVIYSGNELKSFGNLVLVRHSNDYITAYAHAKELRVKRGDAIKGGEIIGMSGQTGNVDTPKFHFEIRKGSTPVDPMQLLHGA
jgi:murein DD-endopeptidase MepM/ murein hydrolase activator NlpD